jgi:hypothetical protein
MSNNLGAVILSALIVGRANTTWWSVVGVVVTVAVLVAFLRWRGGR